MLIYFFHKRNYKYSRKLINDKATNIGSIRKNPPELAIFAPSGRPARHHCHHIMKSFIFTIALCCLLAADLSAAGRHSSGTSGTDTAVSRTGKDTCRRSGSMRYRGFIGGMMLHTGYVCSREVSIAGPAGDTHNISAEGAPLGIGGAIKFMFGKHLRIGTEGYVSTLTFGRHSSHAKTGWGGILADCTWQLGRFRIFAGGTVGGGSQTNTFILSPVRDDYLAEECISYRKYAFFAVAPFAGAEYALTNKVNLVAKPRLTGC